MPARITGFDRAIQGIVRETERSLQDSLSIVERAVKERYTAGSRRGSTSANLGVRSGTLRSNVFRNVRGGPPPAAMVGRVFIRKAGPDRYYPIYALIHEKGGVIRPKKGEFLTFQPGRKAGTAAVKGGPWVRVRQVTIPARPVWATVARETAPLIEARFLRGVYRMIEIAQGTR